MFFLLDNATKSHNTLTLTCDKILLLQKCLPHVGLCVEQTITTRGVGGCQWTEVERVGVFVLNP